MFEQAGEIPVQRAGGFHRAVGKAVQFFQGNFPAVECAEHEPAAVGAEVAGEVMCGHKKIAGILRADGKVSKMFSLNRDLLFMLAAAGFSGPAKIRIRICQRALRAYF